MKKVLLGMAGLLALTACANDGYGYGGGRWYGGGDVGFYDYGYGYGSYYDGYREGPRAHRHRGDSNWRDLRSDGRRHHRDWTPGDRQHYGRR